MTVKFYIDALKEIIELSKSEGLKLEEDIVIAILEQIGIDRREENRNKPMYNRQVVDRPNIPPVPQEVATPKQVQFLKNIHKYKPGITKNEATIIIRQHIDGQEKEYSNKEEIAEEVY